MSADTSTGLAPPLSQPAPRPGPHHRLAPGGREFWDASGAPHRPAQPRPLDPVRAHRLLGVEPVVGAGALPRPGLPRRRRREVPAHRRAHAGRLGAAAAVHLRGRPLRRPQLDRRSAPCCCWSRASWPRSCSSRACPTARCCCSRPWPASAAATSPPRWRTSTPSTRSGSRAGRSGSTRAAATSASRSVQLVGPAVLATAGAGAPAPARRDLPAADRGRRAAARRCAWTTCRSCATTSGRCGRRPRSRTPGSCRCSTSAPSARFIGFGFAFGQVLQVQFEKFATPVKAAYLTFLGPLLGSLVRPVGGRLADRVGGARVTFWNFAAMAVGARRSC